MMYCLLPFLVHVIAMWSWTVFPFVALLCFPLPSVLANGKRCSVALFSHSFKKRKKKHTHTQHLHVKPVRLWCVNSGESGGSRPTLSSVLFTTARHDGCCSSPCARLQKPEWLAAFCAHPVFHGVLSCPPSPEYISVGNLGLSTKPEHCSCLSPGSLYSLPTYLSDNGWCCL